MKEWDQEPNRKHWVDKATGLDCLIVRSNLGHLCGYIGVPKSHPWYKMDYNDCKLDDESYPDVHGGLTYARSCDRPICRDKRLDDDIANKNVWWLGFDCAHFNDFVPKMDDPDERAKMGLGDKSYRDEAIYRNIAYVEKECRSLAWQAFTVTKKSPLEDYDNVVVGLIMASIVLVVIYNSIMPINSGGDSIMICLLGAIFLYKEGFRS